MITAFVLAAQGAKPTANAANSTVRARVGHVCAQRRASMGRFFRSIAIKRAQTRITLANLASNRNRLMAPDGDLERVKGIEPSYSAWEAAALPLSYTRNA